MVWVWIPDRPRLDALLTVYGRPDSVPVQGNKDTNVADIDVSRIVDQLTNRLRPPRSVRNDGNTSAAADGRLAADLAKLRDGCDPGQIEFVSHRKRVGPLVVAIKRALRRLLTPVLARQAEYNETAARAISTLRAHVIALERQRAAAADESRTQGQTSSVHDASACVSAPLGRLLDAVADYIAETGHAADDLQIIETISRDLAPIASRAAGAPVEAQSGERPKAWLSPEEDALVPPRSLWQDPHEPVSHYYRWLWEYLAYLPLLCDLRRDSAVLELGCSHGRTAHGLLHYLRSPGYYRGLDVDRRQIAEAKARIERISPAFQFTWADVYNRHWNPEGTSTAASYVFPFGDTTFDVVYAASVFTHLLPEETERYFRESRRVMKPGGRCLFSFIVLDHYRGPGTTINPLLAPDQPYPGHAGVAVRDLQYPDALIAYSTERITEYARRAGLRVLQVIPGLWSESPGCAVNEQDLVLLAAA